MSGMSGSEAVPSAGREIEYEGEGETTTGQRGRLWGPRGLSGPGEELEKVPTAEEFPASSSLFEELKSDEGGGGPRLGRRPSSSCGFTHQRIETLLSSTRQDVHRKPCFVNAPTLNV